jgi:hypothetical protein
MKGEKRVERTRWLWHHADGFSKIILGKYQESRRQKSPRGSQRNFPSNYGLTSTKEILMNKKLIALAVAGACVAPAAMAQTANPVTLYGRVHVTFESVEATGTGAQVRRNRVQDEASLLGVRGTEDLGAGLKAFFQLETGFKADQNDTTFSSAVGTPRTSKPSMPSIRSAT